MKKDKLSEVAAASAAPPSAAGASSDEALYYVCNSDDLHRGWMDGSIVWWRPEGHGYTYDLNFAGVFTDEHKAKGYPPKSCLYIPKQIVDANSYTPRLAFWSRSRIGNASPLFEIVGGLLQPSETSARPERSEDARGSDPSGENSK